MNRVHAPPHPDQPEPILTRCGIWRSTGLVIARPGIPATCGVCISLADKPYKGLTK